MSRCSVCDYSPDTPSLYYDSLTSQKNKQKLWLDKDTGNYLCHTCRTDILQSVIEDRLEKQDGYENWELHLLDIKAVKDEPTVS